MAKLDPAIRQAITPPEFGASRLHRAGLVDRIHAEIHRRLLVVAAPAGYGKSTLLADFIAHTDFPTVFVRVTEADFDFARLATVLLAALETRFRRLRTQLDLQTYSGGSPRAYARALNALIINLVDEPFALILDDADILNRSELGCEFLDELIDGLPSNVTMIVAGREVPEISLAKHMAEGQLAGFGPQVLAVSRDEAVQLAALASQVELAEREIEELLEATKGWITGLLLSTQFRPQGLGSIASAPQELVYEYLASVVLNRQPTETMEFLLGSAYLPYMTVDLCNVLMDTDDSETLLENLVSSGQFISVVDTSPKSFEYHPMFREFLMETATARDPKRSFILQEKVAELLLGRDDSEGAVSVLLRAGSLERAIELAEISSRDLYRNGRLETLIRWNSEIQLSGGSSPTIEYWIASGLVGRGKIDQAETLVARILDSQVTSDSELIAKTKLLRVGLLSRLGKTTDAVSELPGLTTEIAGLARPELDAHLGRVAAEVLRSMPGRLVEAEVLIDSAVDYYERNRDSDPHNFVNALLTQKAIKGSLGKQHAETVSARRAHSMVFDVGPPLAVAASFNNLAVSAHHAGDFDDALGYFSEALRYSIAGASPYHEALVYLGQADLFNDIGLVYQSAELYEKAIELGSTLSNTWLLRYACLGTGILHRRWTGNAVANSWIQRAREFDTGNEYEAAIRLQLASVEATATPQNALKSLDTIMDQTSSSLEPAQKVAVKYWRAVAFHGLGRHDDFVVEMQAALQDSMSVGGLHDIVAELGANESLKRATLADLGDSGLTTIASARVEMTLSFRQAFRTSPELETGQDRRQLVLRALGQSNVFVFGKLAESIKPQARELLFYLADNGRADRDKLVEVFWKAYPPGRQAANLHMTIYNLRQALGRDSILLDGTAYSLQFRGQVRFDVRAFESASSAVEKLLAGDPRRYFALTEAVRLYSGPFLPEISSDWAEERRRLLERRYIDLVSDLADEALVRNDPALSLIRMREALLVDPLSDNLNMKYLRLLSIDNRRSEIVAHYQRYVEQLSSELGLDPPSEMRELYSRVLE